MATISNTPRPAYAWDSTDNVWYPIGTGSHSHNEVDKTTINAKGDLLVGTANDAYTRQGVGADGSILVADSTQTTGVNWAGTMQYAGKNKIINGDFSVWQRGTSFATPSSVSYIADRWIVLYDGTGSTRTYSQQTFTPGTAPVSGYEGTYFLRTNQSVAGTGATYNIIDQRIEDVRTLAGQTVTLSFWAKASASVSLGNSIQQYFGSGGSSEIGTSISSTSITTSWARYTITYTLGSMSGKTIGSGNYISARFLFPNNSTFTVDIWGVQLEAGSVATPFVPAGGGSQQAELALCQRYFYKTYDQSVAPGTANDNGVIFGCRPNGGAYLQGIHKSTMRVAPTVTAYSPATGTSGKVRNYNSAADENASTGFLGENNAKFAGTTGSNDLMGVHYTASAEL